MKFIKPRVRPRSQKSINTVLDKNEQVAIRFYTSVQMFNRFMPFIDVNSGINQTSHLLFSLEID